MRVWLELGNYELQMLESHMGIKPGLGKRVKKIGLCIE